METKDKIVNIINNYNPELAAEEILRLFEVRRILIDFGIWLDKNDVFIENGNITENVDTFLR